MKNKILSKKEKLVFEIKKLHKRLTDLYKEIFDIKYENEEDFKKFIDNQYKEGGINIYSYKQAYIFINKTIILRIFENKGVLFDEKEYINRIESFLYFIKNYTLEQLLNFCFQQNEISKKFNIYKEEFELNEIKNKKNYAEFINIIQELVDKIDFLILSSDNILGDIYEKFMDEETRKSLGQVYTPDFIIEYIIGKTIEKENIIENPFIKVLDPACGSGHFLIKAYDILRKKFEDNLDVLNKKYNDYEYEIKKNNVFIKLKGKDYWKKENIHYHLLKHCIYGCDIDSFGIGLTVINLIFKDINNFTDEINIINCDSLVKWENKPDYSMFFRFWSDKYDYVVGNPPYVGHKQLDSKYKKWLLKEYGDVFKDKSDLYYCFYKRIIDVLKDKGKACIITPRYFMESPSGINLRYYLKNNCKITEIIDFYGQEIFKGIGVASAIFTFEKKECVDNKVKIYKLKYDNYRFDKKCNLYENLHQSDFEKFNLNQSDLKDERWILISDRKYEIYKKIENNIKFKLDDIALSFQGIITGCDKAFVLSKEDIYKYNIEKNILKKWIKNKNVNKYLVSNSNLMLIYSNFIDDKSKYKNSLNYISKFRNRLENRRECKKGIRKWYELQWGRDNNLFENPKIMYPYKSSSNKFAIDKKGYFCSADVYSFCIKEKFKNIFTLEYLVGILNSKIYEFYFKMFAKKMGEGIYDYYPNSIMDLRIVKSLDYEKIESNSKKILNLCEEINKIEKESILNEKNLIISFYEKKINILNTKKDIYELERQIDKLLSKSFNLTDSDIDFIYEDLNVNKLDELEKSLTKDIFLDIHIKKNNSIEYIANLYKCDELYIEILREKYARKYSEDKPWLFYNLSELYDEIYVFIKNEVIKILKENKKIMNIEEIIDILNKKHKNFENIISTMKNKSNKNNLKLLKKVLNKYSNKYESKKYQKELIRYDKDHYGLAVWENNSKL
ncbi:Eco57I restriction-modification methylase domain-containing protein [Tepidibacter formicigenes]|jgi:type I restriction-modification system DNA methylase subunit|uniref:site-specific DNA-methyltransferase (adenine-specific) n=1 Tax=Tepidibacter formicigenes DSM 15518 TaxID=1123349 RepID=A0A1M6QSK9_9FIRM|nr:N-6 DNA methylase [Tepidibacter formicigenes]SHK23309.1 TaqI-like C-terminal specificity domain-containing protein [Tepidibacter formicigenes DSM 15518]